MSTPLADNLDREKQRLDAKFMASAFALFVLTFLAYIPALRAGYIWDDDSYITNNPTLHSLEGLRQIWFQFGAVPQYYPLVHTTFWLEYHRWGLNPLGYHFVNVVLHGTGAMLLLILLRRLGFSQV